ncbi:SusC/RagA family TonB-linked outer membrane protein [Marinifilum sp.]|uniref:SusC/RagA family TonB-linked outer membrane protein n=1 Tax=Marinifilum sp. TaxID=2033137 RepID=UPI003BAB97A3
MNLKTMFLNLTRSKLKKVIIVLIISFFGGLAPIFSQSISVKFKDITIKEAVEILRTKHNYSFSMNISDIDMNKRITYKANKVELTEVLNTIFKDQGIKCSINGNIITVRKDDAQEQPKGKKVSIKGRVFDEKGDPLVGATLVIKGTTNGTIADFDGNFSLEANTSAILLVTTIGYTDQEFVINDQTEFNITMTPSVVGLDEVVITALGIKRSKKALSYNVQEVSSEDFIKNKDANIINSLSGKVAGLNINSSSSGVGGASKVIMRGTKSIEQSSNALYVIDGVPMFNFGGSGDIEFGSRGTTESIADLNPEDIENISVLTGAAAAALYGSNAANGAIVITTKKGKAGSTSLTITSTTEFMRTFITPEFQNRYGTGDLSSEVKVADRSWGERLNYANYMGYSPKDDFFQTAMVATESISFSTGNENNQTYISSSYIDSKGVIPNNEYDRMNFTFRNTTSFLDQKMKLDIGASYIKQSDRNMLNQGIYGNPLVTAYLFPRGDDWNDVKMYERYNSSRKISTQYWPQGIDEFVGQNPYWIAHRNIRENEKDRYMMNVGLSYDILPWLNISGRARIDNSVNDYEEKFYATSNTTITEGSTNGLYGISRTKNKQTYADVLVNINKTFSDDFNLQANVGTSISDLQEDVFLNRGPIRVDGIPNVFNVFQLDNENVTRAQSGWREQTQSVFGSAEIGFKNAYYLTLTGRNDWPSQLAGPHSNKKSFFYPSVGTSFVLSQIFELPKQIQYAKLRASYASVGLPFKRNIANPTYVWDNSIQQSQSLTHYPLFNLKPEKTRSYEFGLTTKLLGHIDLDLSYYKTETFNQTFDPKISVSSGFTTLYVQTGNVKNTGFELSLGYSNKWGDFSWNTSYTLGSNENEILELVDNYTHPETGDKISKDRLDIQGLSSARFILKKGGSLGDLYSIADLKRDSNGDILVDADGKVSAVYNVDDIKLGSVFPKANMAWRNSFSYKNFNFGFMLSARLGGIVYSSTQATLDYYGVSEDSAVARDRGGVSVNGTDIVGAQNWYTVIGARSGIPQFYTYSATNVRLQEANIGYTIPREKLGNIADVSLSLIGRNLFMIYSKAPFDPEAVATTGNYYQGVDNFMMPSQSSVGFNVRVNF